MGTSIKIVTSDGKEWPCRLTLGAMRRYKAETGEDVSAMNGASDMAVLVWCCVKSACNADGQPMEMSLEDFTDRIGSEEIETIGLLLQGEKKTAKTVRK
jgi:hypothetical protein